MKSFTPRWSHYGLCFDKRKRDALLRPRLSPSGVPICRVAVPPLTAILRVGAARESSRTR